MVADHERGLPAEVYVDSSVVVFERDHVRVLGQFLQGGMHLGVQPGIPGTAEIPQTRHVQISNLCREFINRPYGARDLLPGMVGCGGQAGRDLRERLADSPRAVDDILARDAVVRVDG